MTTTTTTLLCVFLLLIVLGHFIVHALSSSTTNVTCTFDYASFTPGTPNLQLITYSGDANLSIGGGGIDLTIFSPEEVVSHSQWNFGRATYAKPVRLYDPSADSAHGFTTHFTFLINSSISRTLNNDTYGGGGLAFFVSRVNSTLLELSPPKYLGLASNRTNGMAIKQFVALEIDTLRTGRMDPNGNHMGIDVNSINSKVSADWEWDDDKVLNGEASVWYNSTLKTFFARLINKNLSPPSTGWMILWSIDLRTVLPEFVQVGFSSATAHNLESHQLTSWKFTSYIINPDPAVPKVLPKPLVTPSPDKKRKETYLVAILASCFVLTFFLIGTIITLMASRRERRTNDDVSDEQQREEQHLIITLKDQDAMKKRFIQVISEEQFEDTGDRQEINGIDFQTAATLGPRRFSYAELAAATDGFSEEKRRGQGGFGRVYRGVLVNNNGDRAVVAVKRLSKESSQGTKQYVAEVTVISRLRHRNLVPLVGWCQDQGEKLLVYEYMEGGSLDKHLFSTNVDGKAGRDQVLSWAQRMSIALDVASALRYLHEEWVQCVLHRDVKSSNIMIDSEFRARLGDFGLARLVNHGSATDTTMAVGTPGYIAPEYIYTGRFTKQSDVYSFGVVLLELVSGRGATRPFVAGGGGNEVGMRLLEWVWGLYGAGALLEGLDPRLQGTEFSEEEVKCVMTVGLWCSLPDMDTRPAMSEAIRALNFHTKLPTLPSQMPTLVFGNAIPPQTMDSAAATATTITTTSIGDSPPITEML